LKKVGHEASKLIKDNDIIILDSSFTILKITNAKIYFHCCGSIDWVIPDLIDCGVGILNPVQVNAENMDSKKLRDFFGEKVSFRGGGRDPRILLQGNVAQVKEEAKRRIMDFAPNGGFMFASIHNIQANTPPENIVAMFEKVFEH